MPTVIPGSTAEDQTIQTNVAYAGRPIVTSIVGQNGVTPTNPTSPGPATITLQNTPNAAFAGPLVSSVAAGIGVSATNPSGVGAVTVALDGALPQVTSLSGTTLAGPYGIGAIVARAYDSELTTTSATTIVSFTPATNGPFNIEGYVAVTTAATTITLQYLWDDPHLGAQTYSIINAVSEAVDTYPLALTTVSASTLAPIQVIATAGTANQVYVTSIIEVK